MEEKRLSLTLGLVVLTGVISFLSFKNDTLLHRLIFNPYVVKRKNEWVRLLTSGFIHSDWMHLLINMFVLFSFGKVVEEYYRYFFGQTSQLWFLLLYGGGIVVSIIPTYYKQKDNPNYNALGASGAVSAVLFSFILFQPLDKLCLYGILCFPGIVLGAGYLAYSYYAGKKQSDNINHDAHFWGALYGVVFNLILNPRSGLFFIEQMKNFNLKNIISL